MPDKPEEILPKVLAELKRLTQAALAAEEVPIAAVVFNENEIVAGFFNETKLKRNSLKHAEVMCIDAACRTTGNERLNGLSLLTTLEPCLMCSGAIVEARLDRVYYICPSTRGPALSDLYSDAFKTTFKKHKGINHYPELIQLRELEEEYGGIIRNFFAAKRSK